MICDGGEDERRKIEISLGFTCRLALVLGLKEKLAAAGVVTEEQVKKFDEKQAESRAKRRGARKVKASPVKKSAIDVEALQQLNRGEAYDRIRRIVEKRRIDDGEKVIPREEDEVFNFVTAKGSLSRLYVDAAIVKQLVTGSAAISAYMSHHGLSHCVLPKTIALGIAELFPSWLRVLKGCEHAGKVDRPPESE